MLAVLIVSVALGASAENTIFVQLVDRGIPVEPGGAVVKLPVPIMPDGLTAQGQRQTLERHATRYRPQDLLRNSIVAPFVLRIEDASIPETQQPLRRMDVWYVAYGALDACFDSAFLQHLVGLTAAAARADLPQATTVLDDAELGKRGLKIVNSSSRWERYCHVARVLLDRVYLRVTYHVMATRSEESIVVAAVIDRRFTDDADYPNQWQPVSRNMQGRFSLGPAEPYELSAAYVKITRLAEPAGALFVEHHQLFAEPVGWFGGKNLLRSKLPLAVQQSVRRFRRQLRTASEQP